MIGPGSFREVARSVSSTHQTSLLVALLLAASLCYFGFAALLGPMFGWIVMAIGSLMSLTAIGVAVYAVFFGPALLRSERYQLTNRALDLLDDADLTATAQDAATRLVLGFSDPGAGRSPDGETDAMAGSTYIATFDIDDPGFDAIAMKSAIRSDNDIASWWHHLPAVYIIETGLSVHELTRRLRSQVGEVKFLVAEVSLEHSNGWLPEKSWDWIRRRKAATTSAEVDQRESRSGPPP